MTLHPSPSGPPARPSSGPYERVQEMLNAVPDFAGLYAAVELDVFEALAQEPMTGPQLAESCGADPAAMDRLLGWLHARGFVSRSSTDAYRLTEDGHVLTADASPSHRHAVLVAGSTYWWNAIGHLADTIRRGQPMPAEGLPVYEYLACTPGLADQFDRFMIARSTTVGRDLAALNGWADIQVVADLGGGLGGVLASLVNAYPHLRGLLAERPTVTARAHSYLKRQGLLGRVDIVAADLFQEVPRGAQRYLLSSILHNHADDECVGLLARVRQAIEDNAGEVWIIEGMLPRRPSRASPWYSTDIRMMSLFWGGRVRRVSELRRLAELAGLRVTGVTHLPSGQTLLAAQLHGDDEEPDALDRASTSSLNQSRSRSSAGSRTAPSPNSWAAPT